MLPQANKRLRRHACHSSKYLVLQRDLAHGIIPARGLRELGGMMLQLEPIATAPVLDLTPQDVDTIIDELRAYHTIYSPLFQRREQREWSEHYLHGLLLTLPRKSIEPTVLTLNGA